MWDYSTIQQLKDDVNEYIEFYNHRRFHQTLEYKKPMDVYVENLKSGGEGMLAA